MNQLNGFMGNNYCYIASAGAGKTTFVVKDAHNKASLTTKKIAIVTFTSHNQNNERQKYIDIYKHIPQNLIIIGWYTFLLEYFIRPFKGDIIEHLYDRHTSLAFVAPYSKKIAGHKIVHYNRGDLKAKFLTSDNNIYKDYLAEFAFECIKRNRTIIKNRISQIFDTIYFDESQDFCGYDFEIIKSLLKNQSVNFIITTDPRQHTYSSSNNTKYKRYKGRIDLFCEELLNNKQKTYISIDKTKFIYSHRCNASICEFSSLIHSEFPATIPCCCDSCQKRKSYFLKEQGVFLVFKRDASSFVDYYNATILTYNNNVKVNATNLRYNFGECKGDEFESVVIYPTDDILKWLKEEIVLKPITRAKFYVAVTRALFCIGIVIPDSFKHNRFNLPTWSNKLLLND